MKAILEKINQELKQEVRFEERRPGVFQLFIPIFHEDGDMVDLFIFTKNDRIILSDFGLTIQRLAYTYDIDSENKESILLKIISENQLDIENGKISFPLNEESVFSSIMHFTQSLTKIGSMSYFKREVIESLFYEQLDEFIFTELKEYIPSKGVFPIPNRTDLEADYQFSPNGHPIYLFGVKDVSKARLATISCLEYQRANLNFRGWVVNENFEKLSKNDRSRLTNTCDKQFTTLDDFITSAKVFLDREKS